MYRGKLIAAIAAITASCASICGARAWDDAKYPDWKGQWERIGGGAFDADKPPGLGQQAPINAEYLSIWKTNPNKK